VNSKPVTFTQKTIYPVVTPLFEKITLKTQHPHKLRTALHLLQEACPDITISILYPETQHVEAYVTRQED